MLSRGGRGVHNICRKDIQSRLHLFEDVFAKPSTIYKEYEPTKDIIKNWEMSTWLLEGFVTSPKTQAHAIQWRAFLFSL